MQDLVDFLKRLSFSLREPFSGVRCVLRTETRRINADRSRISQFRVRDQHRLYRMMN